MFFSLLFVWIAGVISTATAAEFQTHFCDLNTTSDIYNTSYYSNLIQVLDSLASDTDVRDKRFLHKSAGTSQFNMAYGLYLCRADLLPNDCRNCLLETRDNINNTCPVSKAAVLWSDNCMLRYANYSMVSVMNSEIFIPECNKVNVSGQVSEQNRFWQEATNLTGRLAKRASTNQKEMIAYDEISYNETETIYGYVQCTPDLSGSDCNRCLQVSIDRLPQYCHGREGARVLAASCNVRFEIYKFLQFPTASSEKPGKNKSSTKIIATIVAIVGFLLVSMVIWYFFVVKKSCRPSTSNDFNNETDESETITDPSLQFELGTIEEATNNFSLANKIGEGGFGVVYKGILSNRKEIAVKRLSKGSGQGSLEFRNEVVLLAKLQHRNLVRLLGFCLHAEEKILIYEYVANQSLDFFLFDPTKQVKLDCGYMSPEYAMHGHFSVKSDVFSLGVLVLEIISGKRNTRVFQPGNTDLLGYAWSMWMNGEPYEVLDSDIVESCSGNEVLRCINIALLCVQEDDELRPSMASVVHMLNSDSVALTIPQSPPLVSHRSVRFMPQDHLDLVSHNSIYTVGPTNDSLITDVHPR
ncbi:hypothetical protein L1987_03468 [Smallanthus sonchifolius]|uniref:Uncharacterized protein n=1 Tax=Smallanthus sonchifolius TaxID=185202 RepID=A0ACB9KAT0_9ASTR|nr:hypothetical protein L1987_03468 [Smallanthus sonchifolius]